MLTRDDLDEAVVRGIVDRDQAAQLLALGKTRMRGLRQAAGRDERFVFMRNFNELFVAIGCTLVGLAIVSGVPLIFIYFGNFAFLLGLLPLWGLAELVCRRLRLTLPSIVVAAFFVTLSGLAGLTLWLQVPAQLETLRLGLFGPPAIVAASAALMAAGLFYWRFRLPFALLLIAGAATALLVSTLNAIVGAPSFTKPALLTGGIASFAAAMLYDLSDRERLSRRADCAFWLHLTAGPLIVHSIVRSLWSGDTLTASTAAAIVAIMALFALIALAVDRRALLVSSLVYIGMTISWGFNAFGSGAQSLLATFLLLGSGVIVLGIGWQTVRHFMLDRLPGALVNRLPLARP